jgi:hypothetical protein
MKACPHCGCDVVDAIKGAPRSPEQLRRYFAMLRAVHFNWPENHPRQFATVEELRAWVQMKAGHREVAGRMELGEDREHDMLLAEAMIRQHARCVCAEVHRVLKTRTQGLLQAQRRGRRGDPHRDRP